MQDKVKELSKCKSFIILNIKLYFPEQLPHHPIEFYMEIPSELVQFYGSQRIIKLSWDKVVEFELVKGYTNRLFDSAAREGPEKFNLFVRNFVNCFKSRNLNFSNQVDSHFSYNAIALLVEDEELISLLKSIHLQIYSDDRRTFDLVHLKRLKSVYNPDSISHIKYKLVSSQQLLNWEEFSGFNFYELIEENYNVNKIESCYSKSIRFYLKIRFILKYLIESDRPKVISIFKNNRYIREFLFEEFPEQSAQFL